MRPVIAMFALACGGKPLPLPEALPPVVSSVTLASASDFAGIASEEERSVALFGEMAKVFTHPRCANCHPADNTPRQGMAQHPHEPPVQRGGDNQGVAPLTCSTCHQDTNQAHTRVPGAPSWHLAPIEAAWLGKTPGEICRQLHDPEQNGGRSLEDIEHHLSEDALVGWAWQPGARREPAPGTQQQLADLTRAWMATGAHCPQETP